MEKVASIFEAVAHILPRYHQIHETCRRNAPSPESDPENYNLAILMSWAYADMVRLCLDVHSIIHRIDQGMRHLFVMTMSSVFIHFVSSKLLTTKFPTLGRSHQTATESGSASTTDCGLSMRMSVLAATS